MNKLRALSEEQTHEILAGPAIIPPEIIGQAAAQFSSGEPIINVAAFDEYIEVLKSEKPSDNLEETIKTTHRQMLKLGSTSIIMAYFLAGDINIPRPRRLGEHNQSVANVYKNTFKENTQNPHNHALKLMLSAFQDGGKSYGNALDGNNKQQSIYNMEVARNILPHLETLTDDEKKVIELLVGSNSIGPAIYKYHDKGISFQDVVSTAKEELNAMRTQFPESYRDKFEEYVDIAYRADAGAHTQHEAACFVSGKDIIKDVTDKDRYNDDGSETLMTLDRLFSEAKEHSSTLKFHRHKDLEIMKTLLPSLYE